MSRGQLGRSELSGQRSLCSELRDISTYRNFTSSGLSVGVDVNAV